MSNKKKDELNFMIKITNIIDIAIIVICVMIKILRLY